MWNLFSFILPYFYPYWWKKILFCITHCRICLVAPKMTVTLATVGIWATNLCSRSEGLTSEKYVTQAVWALERLQRISKEHLYAWSFVFMRLIIQPQDWDCVPGSGEVVFCTFPDETTYRNVACLCLHVLLCIFGLEGRQLSFHKVWCGTPSLRY